MVTCPSCHTEYPDGALVCEKDGTTLVTSADALPPTSNELLTAGTMVGEYRIVSMLGEGGFGAVYKAEHPVIGKSAAIKVVKREYSSNQEMTLRFVSEARAVNQIRHKNIIDIFNFGALEDGRQYYVMELLDGTTLDHLIEERGRLTFAEAQPIFRQLARALAAAHAAGIAHRDLKPENVFVAFDEDGAPTAKLLDFGLAKLLGQGMSMHRTRSGVPMGTPLYMSPEQVYGRDVDHRTDVYAFGIMAFQMLTGELPFFGSSVMEVMVKQTAAERPDASAACADVPKALDEPLKQMMAKDPADRPPGILEAIDMLSEAAQAAGIATSGGTLSRRSSDDLPGNSRNRSAGSSSSGSRKPPPGSQSGGSSTSSKRATPATSTAGLATGDTMVDPNLRVTSPGSARAKQAGIAVFAAVLLGGAFFAQRSLSSKPTEAPTPAASTLASSSPVATPSVAPAASPAPVASPVTSAVVAPVPTVVKLKVKASPPDTDVYLGDKRLGPASDVLELPLGATPVKLQFRRNGFTPQTREVVPKEDVEIDVALSRPAARPPVEF
jgi:serine/threonine protein kinase